MPQGPKDQLPQARGSINFIKRSTWEKLRALLAGLENIFSTRDFQWVDTNKGKQVRLRPKPIQKKVEYPPFALVATKKVELDYELTFEPGRVIIANPVEAATEGDGYSYFVPEIDGAPMDERDAVTKAFPALLVSDGQGVYCKIQRDELGMIIPPVQLVADDQDKDSDHYQPEDPEDSGNESNHDLIRILYLDLVDEEIEIKTWRESDIQLTPFLWTGQNVGAAQRVFKEHTEAEGVYRFRTLKGCWGIDAAEDGDVIKFDLAAENIGTGGEVTSGTGASILIERADEDPAAEICDQKLKIKSLLNGAGAAEKQIRVTDGESEIRIHGNGKNGYKIFQNCEGVEIGRIQWEDGLITTEGTDIIIVGNCSYPT